MASQPRLGTAHAAAPSPCGHLILIAGAQAGATATAGGLTSIGRAADTDAASTRCRSTVYNTGMVSNGSESGGLAGTV